jgi:putative heme iron utilization protein
MGSRAEDVLGDLVTTPELNWVIGPGKAVAEGKTEPGKVRLSVKNGWATVDMDLWHCHLAITEVTQVKFVEGTTSKGRSSRSVHFVNATGDSLLRVYFSNFSDDKGDPVPEKQARWETLKAKYGGEGKS